MLAHYSRYRAFIGRRSIQRSLTFDQGERNIPPDARIDPERVLEFEELRHRRVETPGARTHVVRTCVFLRRVSFHPRPRPTKNAKTCRSRWLVCVRAHTVNSGRATTPSAHGGIALGSRQCSLIARFAVDAPRGEEIGVLANTQKKKKKERKKKTMFRAMIEEAMCGSRVRFVRDLATSSSFPGAGHASLRRERERETSWTRRESCH